jgi:hypothetical protein
MSATRCSFTSFIIFPLPTSGGFAAWIPVKHFSAWLARNTRQ